MKNGYEAIPTVIISWSLIAQQALMIR